MVYNTKYDIMYNMMIPKVHHNFLSDEEIKSIIDDKEHDWENGLTTNDGSSGYNSDVRRCLLTSLTSSKNYKKYTWLNKRLLSFMKNVIKKSDFNKINISRVSQMDLCKYEGGGKFDWHTDIIYGESGYQRKLTAVILLNDRDQDYTGGVLKIKGHNTFHKPGDKNCLKRGSIVVFPSYMSHIVTPVTSGTRYSIVAWGEGPYWR